MVFAFATGVTVRAQPYAQVDSADSRSGVGGQSYAAVLGGDPRVSAYLYRVQDENVTSSAQGGLCGQDRTRYLAVSEFVDGSGRWVFKVAAFKRRRPAGATARTHEVCNSYAYTAQ